MAYAADFYIPENIIGYTGVLHKNPTVYFLSATHYGHITQVHDDWRNVGRETIMTNDAYQFGNEPRYGKVLFELDTANNMQHQSRSPMILTSAGTIPPELTHAIMVHPERKALRLGSVPVIMDANLTRGFHPGQQPSDDERAKPPELVLFHWERGNTRGVPSTKRLAAFGG